MNQKSLIAHVFKITVIFVFALGLFSRSSAAGAPRFKILLVSEDSASNPIHYPMVLAAKAWYAKLAADSNFVADWVWDTKLFTDAFLANYKVIVQVNFSPLTEFWTSTSKAAFQKYIEQGVGGWIGMHHASLYGSLIETPGWSWYQAFIGGIEYKDYINGLASATVRLEDSTHACMKNVSKTFTLADDEWYTWNIDPRNTKRIHVLANVDENSYQYDSLGKYPSNSTVKMGDHPVIWTNDSTKYKARNMYMLMGHSPKCYSNTAYTTIVRNAIFWAAATGTSTQESKVSSINNPVNASVKIDKQNISISLTQLVDFNASLTDAAGRIVLKATGKNGCLSLNRGKFGQGIYFLKVATPVGLIGKKVFID